MTTVWDHRTAMFSGLESCEAPWGFHAAPTGHAPDLCMHCDSFENMRLLISFHGGLCIHTCIFFLLSHQVCMLGI
jgi:hypothetical protein